MRSLHHQRQGVRIILYVDCTNALLQKYDRKFKSNEKFPQRRLRSYSPVSYQNRPTFCTLFLSNRMSLTDATLQKREFPEWQKNSIVQFVSLLLEIKNLSQDRCADRCGLWVTTTSSSCIAGFSDVSLIMCATVVNRIYFANTVEEWLTAFHSLCVKDSLTDTTETMIWTNYIQ